jgi:hypothetical protein
MEKEGAIRTAYRMQFFTACASSGVGSSDVA